MNALQILGALVLLAIVVYELRATWRNRNA